MDIWYIAVYNRRIVRYPYHEGWTNEDLMSCWSCTHSDASVFDFTLIYRAMVF